MIKPTTLSEISLPILKILHASLQAALENWGPNKDLRDKFTFKPVTTATTLKTIKSLGNNTSTAHDKICATAIKTGANILAGPITHIVNLSIRDSVFPAKWKIGVLLPLHKGKGLDKKDPKSYCPISLLPVIGKITERLLQPQIMEFMTVSKQLNVNHHSYRAGHSTTTALLKLSDVIFESCNLNKITTLITVDQSAAFDVLSHVTLLRKLTLYNWSEATTNWILSYLSHRSDYVTIGTKSSKYRTVRHGVPQGSVLGPILYVLYINELPSLTKERDCTDAIHNQKNELFTDNCKSCGSIPTYADDSTLVLSTNDRFSAQEKMIAKMHTIKEFLNNNSLTVNSGKMEILKMMVPQKRRWIQGAPP